MTLPDVLSRVPMKIGPHEKTNGSAAEAISRRIRERAEAAAGAPAPMAERGIVTCAGGERLFTCAYVLVRVLRETLGCMLPIEIWHFGGSELSPAMRALLAAPGVSLVDATALLADRPADIVNGWQLKAYALAHSRFAEVLFLDADQVPVRDPTAVFGWPEYTRSGAVFWPDIQDMRKDNPIWALAGLPGEGCPSWESGQLVVDRRRHAVPLAMALALNEAADTVYRMIYGDKDTFLIAWRAANALVEVVPHRPYADTRVLVQRDFAGEPLFQHRTGAKWSYHVAQYELDGFVHAEACLGFLADLRKAWNGRMFFAADRSPAALAEEDRLLAARRLRLICLGDHTVDLELLPGHQLGAGRSLDRQNWYVVQRGDDLTLVLHDGDRPTYVLVRRSRDVGPGVWHGEKLSMPPAEARVDECPADTPPVHVRGDGGLVAMLVAASGCGSGGHALAEAELRAALRLLLRACPGARGEVAALAACGGPFPALVADLLASNDLSGEKISAPDAFQTGYTPQAGLAL